MNSSRYNPNALIVTKEPLAGTNLKTIFTLLAQNNFHVNLPYIPRVLYSLFLSTALLPFRLREHRTFDHILEKTEISIPPLFLLGHWRSGTTYLHNLLSKDEQFGFFSTFDAYAPGVFLGSKNLIKPIVTASLPKKRPMDDVAMDADFPQEEEYALGGSSIYSYYHGWCFPKNMHHYYRYVWFDDVSDKVLTGFKKHYLYLLKKASFQCDGRRLLLKNPSNTARIKILLEMFPDAKFVHIQRNPHHQFLSMVRFMRIVIPLYCVQHPPSVERIEEFIFDMYEHMYTKYLKERLLIPRGNLVEIRYEDFLSDPFAETVKVYEGLGLAGLKDAKRVFKAYILSQSEIHPATYDISEETREKVYSRLRFAFDAFGYRR